MLFDLFVLEFEDLEPFWERSLGSLGLLEIVDDLLVRIGLLDVSVVEEDNCVACWVSFSSHFVAEDDFFLSVHVDALDFAVLALDFVLDLCACLIVIIVLWWEAHLVLVPI